MADVLPTPSVEPGLVGPLDPAQQSDISVSSSPTGASQLTREKVQVLSVAPTDYYYLTQRQMTEQQKSFLERQTKADIDTKIAPALAQMDTLEKEYKDTKNQTAKGVTEHQAEIAEINAYIAKERAQYAGTTGGAVPVTHLGYLDYLKDVDAVKKDIDTRRSELTSARESGNFDKVDTILKDLQTADVRLKQLNKIDPFHSKEYPLKVTVVYTVGSTGQSSGSSGGSTETQLNNIQQAVIRGDMTPAQAAAASAAVQASAQVSGSQGAQAQTQYNIDQALARGDITPEQAVILSSQNKPAPGPQLYSQVLQSEANVAKNALDRMTQNPGEYSASAISAARAELQAAEIAVTSAKTVEAQRQASLTPGVVNPNAPGGIIYEAKMRGEFLNPSQIESINTAYNKDPSGGKGYGSPYWYEQQIKQREAEAKGNVLGGIDILGNVITAAKPTRQLTGVGSVDWYTTEIANREAAAKANVLTPLTPLELGKSAVISQSSGTDLTLIPQGIGKGILPEGAIENLGRMKPTGQPGLPSTSPVIDLSKFGFGKTPKPEVSGGAKDILDWIGNIPAEAKKVAMQTPLGATLLGTPEEKAQAERNRVALEKYTTFAAPALMVSGGIKTSETSSMASPVDRIIEIFKAKPTGVASGSAIIPTVKSSDKLSTQVKPPIKENYGDNLNKLVISFQTLGQSPDTKPIKLDESGTAAIEIETPPSINKISSTQVVEIPSSTPIIIPSKAITIQPQNIPIDTSKTSALNTQFIFQTQNPNHIRSIGYYVDTLGRDVENGKPLTQSQLDDFKQYDKNLASLGVSEQDRSQFTNYIEAYQTTALLTEQVNSDLDKLSNGDTSVIPDATTSIIKIAEYDPDFAVKLGDALNDNIKANQIIQISSNPDIDKNRGDSITLSNSIAESMKNPKMQLIFKDYTVRSLARSDVFDSISNVSIPPSSSQSDRDEKIQIFTKNVNYLDIPNSEKNAYIARYTSQVNAIPFAKNVINEELPPQGELLQGIKPLSFIPMGLNLNIASDTLISAIKGYQNRDPLAALSGMPFYDSYESMEMALDPNYKPLPKTLQEFQDIQSGKITETKTKNVIPTITEEAYTSKLNNYNQDSKKLKDDFDAYKQSGSTDIGKYWDLQDRSAKLGEEQNNLMRQGEYIGSPELAKLGGVYEAFNKNLAPYTTDSLGIGKRLERMPDLTDKDIGDTSGMPYADLINFTKGAYVETSHRPLDLMIAFAGGEVFSGAEILAKTGVARAAMGNIPLISKIPIVTKVVTFAGKSASTPLAGDVVSLGKVGMGAYVMGEAGANIIAQPTSTQKGAAFGKTVTEFAAFGGGMKNIEAPEPTNIYAGKTLFGGKPATGPLTKGYQESIIKLSEIELNLRGKPEEANILRNAFNVYKEIRYTEPFNSKAQPDLWENLDIPREHRAVLDKILASEPHSLYGSGVQVSQSVPLEKMPRGLNELSTISEFEKVINAERLQFKKLSPSARAELQEAEANLRLLKAYENKGVTSDSMLKQEEYSKIGAARRSLAMRYAEPLGTPQSMDMDVMVNQKSFMKKLADTPGATVHTTKMSTVNGVEEVPTEIIYGGYKFAVDPHEIPGSYPRLPNEVLPRSAESSTYKGWKDLLAFKYLGDPFYATPKSWQLTKPGDVGYTGSKVYEHSDVQTTRLMDALRKNLLTATEEGGFGRGARVEKDTIHLLSRFEDAIQTEKLRGGITPKRQAALDRAEVALKNLKSNVFKSRPSVPKTDAEISKMRGDKALIELQETGGVLTQQKVKPLTYSEKQILATLTRRSLGGEGEAPLTKAESRLLSQYINRSHGAEPVKGISKQASQQPFDVTKYDYQNKSIYTSDKPTDITQEYPEFNIMQEGQLRRIRGEIGNQRMEFKALQRAESDLATIRKFEGRTDLTQHEVELKTKAIDNLSNRYRGAKTLAHFEAAVEGDKSGFGGVLVNPKTDVDFIQLELKLDSLRKPITETDSILRNNELKRRSDVYKELYNAYEDPEIIKLETSIRNFNRVSNVNPDFQVFEVSPGKSSVTKLGTRTPEEVNQLRINKELELQIENIKNPDLINPTMTNVAFPEGFYTPNFKGGIEINRWTQLEDIPREDLIVAGKIGDMPQIAKGYIEEGLNITGQPLETPRALGNLKSLREISETNATLEAIGAPPLGKSPRALLTQLKSEYEMKKNLYSKPEPTRLQQRAMDELEIKITSLKNDMSLTKPTRLQTKELSQLESELADRKLAFRTESSEMSPRMEKEELANLKEKISSLEDIVMKEPTQAPIIVSTKAKPGESRAQTLERINREKLGITDSELKDIGGGTGTRSIETNQQKAQREYVEGLGVSERDFAAMKGQTMDAFYESKRLQKLTGLSEGQIDALRTSGSPKDFNDSIRNAYLTNSLRLRKMGITPEPMTQQDAKYTEWLVRTGQKSGVSVQKKSLSDYVDTRVSKPKLTHEERIAKLKLEKSRAKALKDLGITSGEFGNLQNTPAVSTSKTSTTDIENNISGIIDSFAGKPTIKPSTAKLTHEELLLKLEQEKAAESLLDESVVTSGRDMSNVDQFKSDIRDGISEELITQPERVLKTINIGSGGGSKKPTTIIKYGIPFDSLVFNEAKVEESYKPVKPTISEKVVYMVKMPQGKVPYLPAKPEKVPYLPAKPEKVPYLPEKPERKYYLKKPTIIPLLPNLGTPEPYGSGQISRERLGMRGLAQPIATGMQLLTGKGLFNIKYNVKSPLSSAGGAVRTVSSTPIQQQITKQQITKQYTGGIKTGVTKNLVKKSPTSDRFTTVGMGVGTYKPSPQVVGKSNLAANIGGMVKGMVKPKARTPVKGKLLVKRKKA